MRQKRIAAIHDISGAGKCSLTVALPVISAAGVECSCIPTALLSTHTGEFEDFIIKDLSEQMLPIAMHWKKSGLFIDAIYSGYLASSAQVLLLGRIIDELSERNTLVVVDPVMADNGIYYKTLDGRVCEGFRSLCKRADVLTPNVTEAAFLTGLPYKSPPHDEKYICELMDGLFMLGAKTVAMTGLSLGSAELGNAIAHADATEPVYAMRPAKEGQFYGTGDLFASALSALLVRGASGKQALEVATALVDDAVNNTVIRNTERRFGVDFENALGRFIRRVDEVFSS